LASNKPIDGVRHGLKWSLFSTLALNAFQNTRRKMRLHAIKNSISLNALLY